MIKVGQKPGMAKEGLSGDRGGTEKVGERPLISRDVVMRVISSAGDAGPSALKWIDCYCTLTSE